MSQLICARCKLPIAPSEARVNGPWTAEMVHVNNNLCDLAREKAQREADRQAFDVAQKENAELRAKLAQAEQDTARLNSGQIIIETTDGFGEPISMRAMIDSAIAKGVRA